MSLQLLLDSANITAWEEWIPTGIFKGITTNPTLIRQSKRPCNLQWIKKLAKKANKLNCQQLHLQAWGKSAIDLTECGLALSKLSSSSLNIYVKIPLTIEGCQAAINLTRAGKAITFTACFKSQQILIASTIGATYIAPYLGRINDEGRNGMEELLKMQKTVENINSKTKLLVASIREVSELTNLANHGITTFAISPSIAKALIDVPSTNLAANKFELDASVMLKETNFI